jgi:Tol biopolymer transport system component
MMALRESSLVLVNGKGVVGPIKLPPGPYGYPRVSRDGKRLTYGTDEGKDAVVWIYDLSGTNAPERLTFQGASRYPVWSADGQRVAFQWDREGDSGIFWQRADAAGTAERLTQPEKGVAHIPDSSSPDGEVSFSGWEVSLFHCGGAARRRRHGVGSFHER